MRKKLWVFAVVALSLGACQTTSISFDSKITDMDNKPERVSGELFKPEGTGPYPVVVLLHTCGGPQRHTTQDWPDFLTELGYVVFSIDSFGPRLSSTCRAANGRFLGAVQALDALGALDYLATQPFVDIEKAAVMGFSSGAISINDEIVANPVSSGIATSVKGRKFKAAIAVYGTCKGLYKHTAKDIPTLEIAAENDPRHAVTCIERGDELEGVDTFVIKGAYHAFDMVEHLTARQDHFGVVMQYDGGATTKARELTKAFLAYHLLGLPTEKIWKQSRPKPKPFQLDSSWPTIPPRVKIGQ